MPGGKLGFSSFILFLIPLATAIVLASDCWYIPIPTTCLPLPLKRVLVDSAPSSILETSDSDITETYLALFRGRFL